MKSAGALTLAHSLSTSKQLKEVTTELLIFRRVNYYLKGRITEKGISHYREITEKKISHPLVHSPHGHNSWKWASQKPRATSPILIPPQMQKPRLGPSSTVLSGHQQGTGLEVQQPDSNRHPQAMLELQTRLHLIQHSTRSWILHFNCKPFKSAKRSPLPAASHMSTGQVPGAPFPMQLSVSATGKETKWLKYSCPCRP